MTSGNQPVLTKLEDVPSYQVFTQQFDEEWVLSDKTAGILDGMLDRHLSYALSDRYEVPNFNVAPEGPDPVFLIDCSGSMRGGHIKDLVCGLVHACDAMHAAGRNFEILGFTTKRWKGGESRKKWFEAGRPRQPGRLNDRLHLIIKGMAEPWPEARKNLGYLLQEGLMKENIDGEAYAWASERIQSRSNRQVLVPISDGAPHDGSTLLVNPADFLTNHLKEVKEVITAAGIEIIPFYVCKEAVKKTDVADAVVADRIDRAQGVLDAMVEVIDVIDAMSAEAEVEVSPS